MIERGDYTNFEILPDGNLKISLTPQGKKEIKFIKKEHRDWNDYDILADLIDYHLCNGWLVITPESLGALTDSIILSNDAEFDEEGELVWVENSWWYPEYQVVNLAEELEKSGELIFEKA